MKQQKTKKVRAILAGGLVLGVGAAVTLAAWNDSEFAKETFTAGKFNLQGSATGLADSYTDHATESGALELDFKGAINNLSPGDTVVAPYWLRLDATSTTNGTLNPNGVVAAIEGTNAAAIGYTISQVPDGGTCAAGALPEDVVATGLHLNTQAPGPVEDISLTRGTAIQLCLEVTAADATKFKQGLATTATWRFDAVSNAAS